MSVVAEVVVVDLGDLRSLLPVLLTVSEVMGADSPTSRAATLTVSAVSCAALAVSSIATAVSLIAPRSLMARAPSLISLAVSRVASDASLIESTSSSTAPLWRIATTSSLILIDSSLILRAIPLIVSAVCRASIDGVMSALVSVVVEVFPLTLLALAVLLSSEGIVGVTI